MIVVREPIWTALFNLLQGVSYIPLSGGSPQGLPTCSRRLKHWSDVPAEQQPALFLTQGNEEHKTSRPGLSDQVLLKGKMYLYVRAAGEDDVQAAVMNPILDQLQALFPSAAADNPMTGKQTLGGLVQHALIQGELLTFEGTLGQQEVAVIPIEMLVIN